MDTFDYVIVGAGTAGCILANRLSEDAGTTVCVLEAGPRDWHPYIHIPAGFIKLFHQPGLNWLYTQEPSEWTGGRRILAPRGKTLGGSSSINGHIYNRGQRLDYDGWAQRGNRSWGYADVLPYFKRIERRIGEGDETFRGREGAMTVTDIDQHHPLCEAFIAGAESLGIPRNPDYNGTSQLGINYAQRTIHKGRRMSAARAFLHPAMKRPNLTVVTRAHATNLIFEGKRAVGVRYRKGGRNGAPLEVRASREVILSGGTFNSPQLLQMSGVGAPAHLQSLGIDVRHALPGVGENLRDHYAPRVTVRVKNAATINERSRGLNLAAEIAKWCLGGKSILALSPTQVYCFWKSAAASRNLGHPAHLHARELPRRHAGPARDRAGHDVRALAAAAREQGLCPHPLGRSVRATGNPAELSHRGDRPPRAGRRDAARARHPEIEAARAVLRLRGFSRARRANRRRAARRREGTRHHHVPPDGHLPHGAGQ